MQYNNILETIGRTPLVKINKLAKGNLFVKVEAFNPGGSIKDRVAFNMIKTALDEGKIDKATTIIEPTSGNTGIGLSMVCAVLGLKLIIVMPETMSKERQDLMKAYGANLVLTEGSKGMKGAIEKAGELKNEIENSFIPQQFKNISNMKAHYNITAEEIWADTEGKIDIFVAGVGTGGTVTGIGKKLKEYNPNIKVIALEPFDSPFLSEGRAGAHKIQGIGAGFKPDILDLDIVDEIITVKNEDAINMAKLIAKEEGILAGISAGANVFVSAKLANENPEKTVVTVLPDTGERYLSTNIFS